MIARKLHEDALIEDLRDVGISPDSYLVDRLIEKGWRKNYVTATFTSSYGEHDRPEYSYFHNEPRLF